MKILVFNCGSSSLKFALLEVDAGQDRRASTVARGNFERIGDTRAEAVLVDDRDQETRVPLPRIDHSSAALHAIAWLEELAGQAGPRVDATAHRIVHGGARIFGPVVLGDSILTDLEQATSFAPLHNPPALATIRTVRDRLPSIPVTVLSDTAFHRDLPDYARNYALPRALVERHDIRRFGFHGIGHAWMTERYAELVGADPTALNLITLQLGAGSSATAIRAGKSVDTSMGLTPLEGLMMSTRSGDIDPAIVGILCRREGISLDEVESILNHQSGLLGVSGISGDIRDLLAAADQGNVDAALAIEMFCYRVRKYIGQYVAILGKVDAIIFGGGIGEHADRIRAQICEPIAHLGIAIDSERNRRANGQERPFSREGSPIALHVVPLQEELYIARSVARLLAGQS